MNTLPNYQVSARVVLAPGDRFRVSGGPYWRTAGGERIPLATRGVCRLLAVCRDRRRTYLVVQASQGIAVLHVEGRRRNKMMPELVCRPYKIRGKIREKEKAIAKQKPIA